MPLLNAEGIVLSRRAFGESARAASVYTKELGKIPVRFTGVERPGRKLKAFSEPLSWCEYRLHLKPGAEYAQAAGGNLISSFPNIRKDLERLGEALFYCELTEALSAPHSPNPEKYRLLASALTALDEGAELESLGALFGLRFLETAGYGVRERCPILQDGRAVSADMWEGLYRGPLGEKPEGFLDSSFTLAIRDWVVKKAEAEAQKSLRAPAFAASVAGSLGEAAVC